MSIRRTVNKYRKCVLRKLEKWELKNRFEIDYDSLKSIINRDFDILIKEGLKFNIHLPLFKELLIRELGRACLILERNEKFDCFDFIFCCNSINENNEEFLELVEHKKALNSEIFRPILEYVYDNGVKGQPNIDPLLIFNISYLQAKYDLSDEQILKDIEDRKSFKYFLNYPENLPCSSTLGNFRDRLINYEKINEIWFQHQQYLALKGYSITEELAIDASFLDANPGSYGKPRGELAKTRRIKDGTHMTKNNEHHFGFKIHIVIDLLFQLIRFFEVTTAAVHDSQVTFDLTRKFIMYADKGYIGANFTCQKGYMLRKSNDPKTNAFRTQRNWRISRKRAPVERVFAVFKEHGQNFTKLTTTARNQVKTLFSCLLFNTQQIITLQKEKQPIKKAKKEVDRSILFNFLENTYKIVENREKIEYMRKRRRNRIKNSWEKFISMFKKPKRRKRMKKSTKKSQNPNKKRFNRKLAYSF